MHTNTYSVRWFEVFGDAVDPAQTQREIDFLKRMLPLPDYCTILDVCCGSGRHAIGLAAAGYSVTGVDADANAINAATVSNKRGSNARFILGDMRELDALPPDFDGLICMWQSFGHFDDQTNQRVLRMFADRLGRNGRLVLDVYHRAFFEANQGTREFERNGMRIIESKRIERDRLAVQLDYPDGETDRFEWRIYTLDEWRSLLAAPGFALCIACCDFDERNAPSVLLPRMQLVAAKRANADADTCDNA